ncbi:TonB-dependent receptor [Parasphingorhabdus sp. JC815]|uniref:TonB-dependent receptor n=1 Tax=Parasphingorhabdus sp. JC815 TaxID=3232140 RepID=UPI00345AFB9E
MTKKQIFKQALLVAVSSLVTVPAFAQDVSSETAQPINSDKQYGGLEEIVVTARKSEERLSDAPLAVSAVSSRTIENLGLNSIDDFSKLATGISFSQAFGRSGDRPVIRGQSSVLAGVQAGVESGAAYFVDGIYYQGNIQAFDPQSLERVEVIKGPQSALYGRNTYSGAINYITKDPTEYLTASGRLTVAEYGEVQASASVSDTYADGAIGFRAGARYYKYDGEFINQLTGKKVGQEESKSAYVSLVAKPSDDIKIRLRGSYDHQDDGPFALFLQGSAENNCSPGYRSNKYRTVSPFLPNVPAPLAGTPGALNENQYFCGAIQAKPNDVRQNTDPLPTAFGVRDGTAFDGLDTREFFGSAAIDYDIGGSGFVLSSLTGYRNFTRRTGQDNDISEAFFYFGPPVGEPTFASSLKTKAEDFSQELRIATPTDRKLHGLLGVYYYHQKIDKVDITFANPFDGEPLGTDGSARNTITNKAVFALLGYDFTDSFGITGEVRYQEETQTIIDRASATSIFCSGAQDDAALFGFTGTCDKRNKFTGTDPRITINYTTPGGMLLYGVFATGRKPGGSNGATGTSIGQPRYNPEKVQSFEVGAKFDTLDNKLRVQFAAYTNKLSQVQIVSSIPTPVNPLALASIVTNGGDARTTGFELEATAVPTQGLTFNLGVSYVDAKFTNGCDADLFILNSGGLRPNFDTTNPPDAALPLCSIKGKRLPLGSQYILNGSASYEHPVGPDLDIFGITNFSFESKKYVQTDNFAYVPSAFLLGARIGIRSKNFSLAVFGRNLTNEDAPPLATRWFDYRYGAGTQGLPPASSVTFNGQPAVIESGAPRGFFGRLRKSRTFGIEGSVKF